MNIFEYLSVIFMDFYDDKIKLQADIHQSDILGKFHERPLRVATSTGRRNTLFLNA
jgi:hypothetical protein